MSIATLPTIDLYAEEIAVVTGPVAEFCEICVECEGSEFCEGGNCEGCSCDTGSCDCFSVFCDSCIA
jgi:hypothetical protein